MLRKICADCEELIKQARVDAIPTVTTCIECQEGRENDGNFHRHVMDVQATSRCGEIDSISQKIIR